MDITLTGLTPDLVAFVTRLQKVHLYDTPARAVKHILSAAMHANEEHNKAGPPSVGAVERSVRLSGEEGCSAKDVAFETQFSPLTVSKALKHLLGAGRVVECGYRKGSGPSGSGYPARLFKVTGPALADPPSSGLAEVQQRLMKESARSFQAPKDLPLRQGPPDPELDDDLPQLSPGAVAALQSGDDYSGSPYEAEIEAYAAIAMRKQG